MKRKVQAQRKFAQGAYVPPTQNNNTISHRAEIHAQPKEDRNITLNKVSAKNLLDIVSFHGIHTHAKPIVLLERLANPNDNEAVVPNVAVAARENQSAPVTPNKHARTPKSKSRSITMCLRSGSRTIDKKAKCLRNRQRYSQVQLDKKKTPMKKRSVVNIEPLSDFDDETPLKYFKSLRLRKKKAVNLTETNNLQEKKKPISVKATKPHVVSKKINKTTPLDKQTPIKQNIEINKTPQKQSVSAETVNKKQYYERNRIEGWIDSVQRPTAYLEEAQATFVDAQLDRQTLQKANVAKKRKLTNPCRMQNLDQNSDVYDFDAERDAQESIPLIYKRKQKNSRANETNADDLAYLDFLPTGDPHMVQVTPLKIPNHDKTMMSARLIPRTVVHKTQENVLLVQHDGLLDQLLEEMVPSCSHTTKPNNDEMAPTPKNNSNNKTIVTPKVLKKSGVNSKRTIVQNQTIVKNPKQIILEKSKNIDQEAGPTCEENMSLLTRRYSTNHEEYLPGPITLVDEKVEIVSEGIEDSNLMSMEKDMETYNEADIDKMSVADMETMNQADIDKMSVADMETTNQADIDKMRADMETMNQADIDKISIADTEIMNPADIDKISIADTEKNDEADIDKISIADTEKNDEAVDIKSEIDSEEGSTKTDIEGVVEAPTYYLNEDEFSDPLAFFEKVLPIAAKYGLCKVVAPDGFKPKCIINDNMKFKVSNQYIGKLYSRWGAAAKEMCAIKAYLATHNVHFWRAPLLDGRELDLPKLYHLVQKHGGLKQVIEKKRWSKVAAEMLISDWTPYPEKALDKVYVKYLLPYDTLSNHERAQIINKVETSWKNRNDKLVRWALNPLHRAKKLLGDSESSDEEEQQTVYMKEAMHEAEDCVVPGRFMNLSRFKKIALILKDAFFGKTDASCSSIEKEYWRIVLNGSDHVSVNAASVDTGNTGFGFPKKNETGGKHPWNLKMMSKNSGNVLRSLGAVLGVTVPTLHLGMVFSTSCWHRDPHGLPWIEFMHSGPPKVWYGIPNEQSEKFRKAVESLCPTWCQNKSVWLPSDVTMIPPELLKQHGVELSRVKQKPGEFIIVFPKAYSCSLTTDYTISESVYFATESWLMGVQDVFAELAASSEPTMFSLEQLAVSLARDDSLSGHVLRFASDLLRTIRNQELSRRAQWRQKNLEWQVSQRKKKHTTSSAWNVREQDECEVCRATLYLSKVLGIPSKKSSLCLEHALQILNMPKHKDMNLESAKLVIYYPDEELEALVNEIEEKI